MLAIKQIEMLRQLEKSCESKAAQKAKASPAYRTLWQTLELARADAEASLKQMEANEPFGDASFLQMIKKVRILDINLFEGVG